MSPETKDLRAVVAKLINDHGSDASINVAAIADEAYTALDPANVAGPVPLVVLACRMWLKQVVRDMLHDRFDDDRQFELFGKLQRRYPSHHRGGEYVFLNEMTRADVAANVARLAKEGTAKSAHAAALAKFGIAKFGPDANDAAA
jgi:hypothetical protein